MEMYNKNWDYYSFDSYINDYIDEGYSIPIDLILCYLHSMIDLKKSKEAFSLAKNIAQTLSKEEELVSLGYIFYDLAKYDMIFSIFPEKNQNQIEQRHYLLKHILL